MPKIRITVTPPSSNAKRVVSIINERCAESTFTYPLVISNGEGCYLQDPDGNVFLDFTSNIGTAPLGYSHPDILEVLKEYSNNGAYKIAGQDFYCNEHAELAQKVLSIAPKGFKAFFINSGAEAVENSIKLAYRYTGKGKGISCLGAFHGRTLGALTFTYSKPVQKKNYPELPVKRIKFCISDDDPSIDELEKEINEDIAFILTEIIQGEGGYNIASKRFIKTLYRITKQYNIPFIIDEVQSGLGRTGKWWAFQHYGIEPNIMSVAKALQVGATLFDPVFNPEKGAISSTWGGGHRIDMAVGSRIIEVIEREHLLDNASKRGQMLLKRLQEMKAGFDSNEGLVDVRGLGLMIGLEFDTTLRRDKVIQNAFRSGLLLLPAGTKSIRISPPLIIGNEEIEEGLLVLSESIKAAA